ncbi:hypothetical protein BDN72DRAFT_494040 [Pluteus cervinus]|uniref:Uncharacterized protein n=1 Tax=Pluteus cervinus TaxID=181527 RepID=A0ACD3AZK5_9AGAR|nr:hypothetical protein BDN72DRAFT_494040 [Pluteus cervinus]
MNSSGHHLLPNELWEHVFLYLDYPSALRCQQVCRFFNSIISASANIQYHGELTMDGMIDTNASNLPVVDRLALLRERRAAWHSLDWQLFPAQSFPRSYHAYDFVGGTFAILLNNEFIAITFPTKTSEGSRKSHHLDFAARDFAMDPTQDLAIFLGEQVANDPVTYIYVRTYETIASHPQSEQSRIAVHLNERPHDCMVQIVEDLFAFASSNSDESRLDIRIWNWKTGQIVHDHSHLVDDADQGRAESFALLSSKAFAIGIKTDSGHISIWDIDSGAEVSRLCLPELADPDEWSLESVSVDAPPYLAHPRPDRTFMTSPGHRVISFSLTYSTGSVDLRAYILSDFLTSYATPRSSDQDIDVPWEDWGPLNTRVMDAGDQDDSDTHCQGFRVALAADDYNISVRILDFNPRRPAVRDPSPSDAEVVSADSSTTVSYPWIFEKDIETHLPYTMHIRELPDSCPVDVPIILLDECHVVPIGFLGPGSEVDLFPMAI